MGLRTQFFEGGGHFRLGDFFKHPLGAPRTARAGEVFPGSGKMATIHTLPWITGVFVPSRGADQGGHAACQNKRAASQDSGSQSFEKSPSIHRVLLFVNLVPLTLSGDQKYGQQQIPVNAGHADDLVFQYWLPNATALNGAGISIDRNGAPGLQTRP
jgi:hypothetical protein